MKWIAVETVDNEGRKTEVFKVYSKHGSCSIGLIKWKASWRKYAFFPYGCTHFDYDCLREIAGFLEEKTKEYKKSWA